MMGPSNRSEALVVLGKKIVSELGLDDSVDTLGRWMAHHIAELVREAEVTTDDSRQAKHAQLRDAILAIWAHRFELPTGKRPFGEFEPILRALASLDPEAESYRYFSPSRAPANESDEPKETRQWIELATNLDRVSKILIDHCFTLAAEAALDKSKEWVKLAESAGIDDSFEFAVIRIIRDRRDLVKGSDPSAHQRRVLTDRRQKLEKFVSMASKLANDIGMRLDSLPPISDDPDALLLSDINKS